jgi:hypothetical protein
MYMNAFGCVNKKLDSGINLQPDNVCKKAQFTIDTSALFL